MIPIGSTFVPVRAPPHPIWLYFKPTNLLTRRSAFLVFLLLSQPPLHDMCTSENTLELDN